MAVQKQDDQHEHTFSSYVRIRDVVLKTYLGRWTIRRSGERGSGISVLPARYDDYDDDDDLYVSFSPSVLITNWFGCSTPLMCRLSLFITSMLHFSSPNSFRISWLYMFIIYIRVSNPLSFLAKKVWCRPCTSNGWSFSCDLLSFFPLVHFLSNGDCASSWNMLLWIYTFAELFSHAVSSTLQISMVF